MDLEAAGTRVWLRDKHGNKVIYCNDGNYYCNVLNWDWTQQAVRDLYVRQEPCHNKSVGGCIDIQAPPILPSLSSRTHRGVSYAQVRKRGRTFELTPTHGVLNGSPGKPKTPAANKTFWN